MSSFKVVLELYLPIIIFLALIVILIRSKKGSQDGKFTISLLGVFSTDLSIRQVLAIKLIIGFLLFLVLTMYYLFIDFTKFYPQRFKMTVHFDKKGINNIYNQLGIKEVDGFPIDMEDDSIRKTYILKSDKTLKEKMPKIESFFSRSLLDSTATMTTEGYTTFVVKKRGGLQNYFIEEASGELLHTLYDPPKEDKQIKTSFSKVISSNDKIRFNYFSTLFGNSITITPLFTECLIVKEHSASIEKIKLDHFLYGITTLKVCPFPSYSSTLYLYKAKNKLVPICYAIYKDE